MNIVPITTETIAPYLPLCGGDAALLRTPGRYALGAQEHGKAVGLLLYRAEGAGAEIVRLAWSQDAPDGVGQALVADFLERRREKEGRFAFALLGEAERERLGVLLAENGFVPAEERGSCWEFSLSDLRLGEGGPQKRENVVPLEEVPGPVRNRFFGGLSGGAVPDRQSLDGKASHVLLGREGIQAAILLSFAPDGDRNVELLYLCDPSQSAAMLSLLRAAAASLRKTEGADLRLFAAAGDPQTDRLVQRLAPDAKQVSFPLYRFFRMDLDHEARLIWEWDNARFEQE
ncbi:MAG: hypothetical protein Q4C65_06775 [Eubacteriales bacterium]|nr:hypothetical protein [Eubacteriales bacterium]